MFFLLFLVVAFALGFYVGKVQGQKVVLEVHEAYGRTITSLHTVYSGLLAVAERKYVAAQTAVVADVKAVEAKL